MNVMPPEEPKSKRTFRAASQELEEITRKLESGKFDVDEALKLFERGLELARYLKKRLTEVDTKVKELKEKFEE